MRKTQGKQTKLEKRFEYEGYGFKAVNRNSEMFFTLNMEYKIDKGRRVYLKTVQSIGEVPTSEETTTPEILQKLSIEWIEEESNVASFLAEEFKACQELDEYEDDPYKEEYF